MGADAEVVRSKRSGWQWVVGALVALPAVLTVPKLLLDPVDVVFVVILVVLDVALPLVVAWLATRPDAPRAPIGLAMAATLAGVGLVASLGTVVAEVTDPGPAFALRSPLLRAGVPLVIPLVMLLAAVHTVRVRDDPRRMRLPTWPKVTAAAIVGWVLATAPVSGPVLRSLPATQKPTVPLAASGAGALIGLAGFGLIAWFVGRTHTLLVVPAAVVVTAIALFVSLANAAAVLTDVVPLSDAARATPFPLAGPAVVVQLAAAALLTAATARLTVAARRAWRQQPQR